MVNINSKINWQAGLELTEQTFRGMDRAFDSRISALRIALANGQFGLLPGSDYYNNATFVKRTIEISNLRCTALLRSGDVIQIDESVTIEVKLLYEDVYYVVASMGSELHHFEYEGVPMVRPVNEFKIITPQEIDKNHLPLVKLRQESGTFVIDTSFTPPSIVVGVNTPMAKTITKAIEVMEGITSHANLEPGETARSLRRLLYELRTLTDRSLTSYAVSLMEQLQQCLDYYIVEPNSLKGKADSVAIDFNDIGIWLERFTSHLGWVLTSMESVVLEDRSIDYERLKRELYGDLSELMMGEIYQKMHNQLSIELREEIARDVKEPLMKFITGEVRDELYKELLAQLMKDLSAKLSPELYDKLYAALYVEAKVEDDTFFPLI